MKESQNQKSPHLNVITQLDPPTPPLHRSSTPTPVNADQLSDGIQPLLPRHDVGELLYITVAYVELVPFVPEPKRFIPPLEDLSSAERSMYNGFNSFISLASPNILSALTYILTYDFDKIDFTTLPTLPTPHIDATVRHAYCEHISKMLITEFLKDKELTSSLEIDYIWPITHNRIGHPASCSSTSDIVLPSHYFAHIALHFVELKLPTLAFHALEDMPTNSHSSLSISQTMGDVERESTPVKKNPSASSSPVRERESPRDTGLVTSARRNQDPNSSNNLGSEAAPFNTTGKGRGRQSTTKNDLHQLKKIQDSQKSKNTSFLGVDDAMHARDGDEDEDEDDSEPNDHSEDESGIGDAQEGDVIEVGADYAYTESKPSRRSKSSGGRTHASSSPDDGGGGR
jgi:hypothetical protein